MSEQKNKSLPSVGHHDSPLKGIAYLISGVSIFTLQDVIIKWISGGYPVHEIVFFRSLAAIIPILLIVRFEGGYISLRTRRPWAHLLRGGLMFTSYTSFYLAIAALPLADAVTLLFSSPLFVTALSVPFLREGVGLRRWLTIFIGFLGVVIMLRPGTGVVDPAALLSVLSAIAYAVSVLINRRLGRTDSGSSLVFYSTVLYLIVSAIVGLIIGDGSLDTGEHASLQFLFRAWVFPVWVDLGLMALCGFIAALGFYFLSQAYRVARATTVTPFEYIAIVLAVIWGYLFWGDLPDAYTVTGALLVVGSGLSVVSSEARRTKGLR